MMMIDGDILLYSCGFAAEGEPVAFAIHSLKMRLQSIMSSCGKDKTSTIVAISGEDNFRDGVATLQSYKGNRKDVQKPEHYAKLREWIIKNTNCVVSVNEEADDLMGKALCSGEVGIIATIDKDLNMIPGAHYNFKSGLYTYISEEEAFDFFIRQLLTGDATDNIPGLYRTTKVKASKAVVARCIAPKTKADKFIAVIEEYTKGLETLLDCPDRRSEVAELAVKTVLEIGELLWIRRDDTPFSELVNQWLAEEEHGSKESQAHKSS